MKFLILLFFLLPIQATARSAALYNFTDSVMEVSQNDTSTVPIASITKLFTAMAVIDSGENLFEQVKVQGSATGRLPKGSMVTRIELLKAMLIASDNRASDSLAHAHPGGYEEFIKYVNDRISDIGLRSTTISDASGLSANNISTAEDLVNFVWWLRKYPLIVQISSMSNDHIEFDNHRNKPVKLQVRNTNPDISKYNVLISKTGFTSRAGRCLLMLVNHNDTIFGVVVLGEKNTISRSKVIRHLIYKKEYNK